MGCSGENGSMVIFLALSAQRVGAEWLLKLAAL